MAEPIPAGSEASAGTYRCTNCGYELQVGSTQHLPPCPPARTANGTLPPEATAASTPTPRQLTIAAVGMGSTGPRARARDRVSLTLRDAGRFDWVARCAGE